jgi:alkylation response protein AidB-like acyl-CoA dehydrogenase
MNLDPTDTQELLRNTLRGFLEAEVPFSQVRECEIEQKVDTKLWAQLAEQGYLGLPFPSEIGGGDGGLVEAGILIEEVARRAAVVPIVETIAAALTLQRKCDCPGASAVVENVLAGSATVVPAVLEANDSYEEFALEADAEGVLRGEKLFVDYAEVATHHLVVARDADGLALYTVPTANPAVKCEPIATMGRTPQSRVRYDGAVGKRAGGPDAVAYLIQVARALTCAQILACMDCALEQTVAYTNVREQFGRPLATFQAVQHHGANMGIHCESSRFLTYEALDCLERGDSTEEQIAIAKASLSRAIPDVVMTGHQLHGGQGYIEENDLYFFTIRGKDRALAWGTAEECLEIVARSAEEKARWL